VYLVGKLLEAAMEAYDENNETINNFTQETILWQAH